MTETRHPGQFDYIEVFDKIDVTIYNGPEYKVEITAGENIIGKVTSEVDNGILRLDNSNKCNFVRGYKREIRVKITTPKVTQISNLGVGPVTLDENFHQESIFIRAENSGDTYINGTFDEVRTSSHGNGDMYLSGNTRRLMIYSLGTNFTYAQTMKVSDYIYISTYSIGDAYFNLDGLGQMDYLIWSDGSIYYKGHANLIRNLSEQSARGKAVQQD